MRTRGSIGTVLARLRDRPLKCIYELDSGGDKLFDVTADPDGRKDVSSAHPADTRRYEPVELGIAHFTVTPTCAVVQQH